MCLPIVCLLVLGVVQVGIVIRGRLLVIAAAREGARAAAVSASPSAAASRAVAEGGLGPLSVSTSTGGGFVTVTVGYDDPTDVPLIGALLPDVHIEAAVTMALEPP